MATSALATLSADAAAAAGKRLLLSPPSSSSLSFASRRIAAAGLLLSGILRALWRAVWGRAVAVALLLLTRAAWLAVQCAFLAAQILAHLAAVGTVAAEKAAAARGHPVQLRLFWLGTAALGALFSGSAVARYAAGEPIIPDDPIAFVGLVLSLPLLCFSINGSTGLGDAETTNEEGRIGASDHAAVATSYATASCLSLATFEQFDADHSDAVDHEEFRHRLLHVAVDRASAPSRAVRAGTARPDGLDGPGCVGPTGPEARQARAVLARPGPSPTSGAASFAFVSFSIHPDHARSTGALVDSSSEGAEQALGSVQELIQILPNKKLHILCAVKPTSFAAGAGKIDATTTLRVRKAVRERGYAELKIVDLQNLEGFLGWAWKDIQKKLYNIKIEVKFFLYLEGEEQLSKVIKELQLGRLYLLAFQEATCEFDRCNCF